MKTLQFHDKGKDGKQRWKYFMIIYEELKQGKAKQIYLHRNL